MQEQIILEPSVLEHRELDQKTREQDVLAQFYSDVLRRKIDQRKQQENLFEPETDSSSIEQIAKKSLQYLKIEDPILQKRCLDEIIGMGPIQNLLEDDEITEVLINSWDTVFFERKGVLHRHQDQFTCESSFEDFIERICRLCQTFINRDKPYIECQFENFRISVIYKDLARGSHLVSFRKKQKNYFSLNSLIERNWCSQTSLGYIRDILTERKNFLVVGGTGSGKTTVLQSLIAELPGLERVVIIEDTQELHPIHPVSVSLLTQTHTMEPKQVVTMDDLLKRALRLRPDRIGIGEIRGPEAKSLLMALSTGHEGSFGSLHAKNADEALLRLEMLVQMGAPTWSIESIRKLIAMTIDFIFVVEKRNGLRVLEGIYQIGTLENAGITLQRMPDS